MRRFICAALAALYLTIPALAVETLPEDSFSLSCTAAVLMERQTGTVLYEKEAHRHLSPASVTKVMTLLLVAEAVESGAVSPDDPVTASRRAASMGGSQIWLEEGEQMSVDEMLKCVAVVSANDCCVALAEHIAGTEDAFVARMNERAAALGMENTHFTCCSGLMESDEHYTTARDIALMSCELMRHDMIRDYTTIWMDTARGGAFGLANTNKLIYYYKGATGLKTGFTRKAMYCLSAAAERDGVEYIAVVLHAPTSTDRFESAKTLLNYAFANYTLVSPAGMQAIPPVPVRLGAADAVQPVLDTESGVLVERGAAEGITAELDLPESLDAPVEAGQMIGYLTVRSGGESVQRLPLRAAESVERLSLGALWRRFLCAMVGA